MVGGGAKLGSAMISSDLFSLWSRKIQNIAVKFFHFYCAIKILAAKFELEFKFLIAQFFYRSNYAKFYHQNCQKARMVIYAVKYCEIKKTILLINNTKDQKTVKNMNFYCEIKF